MHFIIYSSYNQNSNVFFIQTTTYLNNGTHLVCFRHLCVPYLIPYLQLYTYNVRNAHDNPSFGPNHVFFVICQISTKVYLVLLSPILLPRLWVGALIPGDVGRAQRQSRQVNQRATAPQRRAHIQGDQLRTNIVLSRVLH